MKSRRVFVCSSFQLFTSHWTILEFYLLYWILFLGLDIYFTFTFILDGFAFKYSTKLILPDQDPSGSHIGSLCVEMAGNSNKNADIDSSFTSVPATHKLFSSPEPDDIFLTVQRSTFVVGKIYNDLFANSRSDFISELSELCCVAELRYVRDMVFCIVKRKLGQSDLGSLIERRSGANVKDNLLKDIYNLYSLGEKSIDALPKNMIRSDTRFCSQGVQTDTCLSNTLFATKSDVEELKNDFLSKLSDLREEFTSVKCPPAPVVSSPSESDDDSTQVPSSQVSPSSTLAQTPASSQNKNVSASGQVHKAVDKPNPGKAPSRKVLIAGDSLLNRMYISKMKVSDIPSVKLTKRGDNLSGTISRCINYASKHNSETLNVVLLAGTNDLSNRSVSPEKLINTLDSSLKELKQFNNVHHVFLCKIPPRFDFHNVIQLIMSSCLTVYLIVLFPVKYLNRLLTIHQTISLLNLKLTTQLILVLLCLLTTVLTRELEIKLGGQNLQWKIF